MIRSERHRRLVGNRRRAVALVAVAAASAGLTACNDDGRDMREPRPDQTLSIITTTVAPDGVDEGLVGDTGAEAGDDAMGHSDATVSGFDVALPWPDGDRMPDRHTCVGEGVSPALSWAGVPEGTVELALVVRTPTAADSVHWIAAGLASDLTRIAEGARLRQAIVGTNDVGVLGWSAPCPAEGESLLVRIEVHALGQQLEVQSGDPATAMLAAIEAATIATAVGTGIATG